MVAIYQFTPKEVFVLAKRALQAASESSKEGAVAMTEGGHACPELLLEYGKNMIRYGRRPASFHAKGMGIAPLDFRRAFPALTGKTYPEFDSDLFILFLNDSLTGDVEYGTLKEEAKRLGMSSSGLYRFMKRTMDKSPSGITHPNRSR